LMQLMQKNRKIAIAGRMVVRVQLRHSFSLDIRNDGKQVFDLKKDPAKSQDR
jgi:hypothetical protein